MKFTFDLMLAMLVIVVIFLALRFVDEKVCTHICPRKKECIRKNNKGELPPCMTCNGSKKEAKQ